MTSQDLNDVRLFVENNIGAFHEKRLEKLQKFKLKQVLKRKNPYLFRAKNVVTGQELVQGILDAYLSSQEETLFGQFIEELAIFVAQKVYHGHKSTAEGIDLELQKEGIYYIVSIESGPDWGNSSQIQRMKRNFTQARRRLRQNAHIQNIMAVNGCCYGQDNQPDKGDYLKLCGQNFWTFISGNERLYLDIIEPLGHQAKERDAVFQDEYTRIINLFTIDFMQEFSTNGRIDWEKLVAFNSAAKTK